MICARLTVRLEGLRAGSNAAWLAWHHTRSVRAQHLLGHEINLNITIDTGSLE